jgi:hypothetical protein
MNAIAAGAAASQQQRMRMNQQLRMGQQAGLSGLQFPPGVTAQHMYLAQQNPLLMQQLNIQNQMRALAAMSGQITNPVQSAQIQAQFRMLQAQLVRSAGGGPAMGLPLQSDPLLGAVATSPNLPNTELDTSSANNGSQEAAAVADGVDDEMPDASPTTKTPKAAAV